VRVPQGPPRGKGVVVGSGPGGLSSAWALARGGMQVTLYEASHLPVGLPAMAIPPFRLPRKALEEDISFVLRHGVELELNHPLEPREVTALLQENDFVILACGAPRERKANLPGSDLPRVWSGLDFLRRAALGPPPDLRAPVVVVGGGNMAMDSARWALRSASEVTLIYRRDRNQMTAYGEEVEAALAEGLHIVFRTLPVALEGDREKGVQGIRVQNTAPHGKDAEGRTLFTPLSGSEKSLSAGSVILALGQEGGVQHWIEGMGLDVWVPDRNGLLASGIYAAGDMVTGPSTMVEAMAGGIACAREILRKGNG
jgi:NADPH-dependent glutamate synthase beta subunit-like oxidoreductase